MIASGAQLDVVTIYPFAAGEWVAGNLFRDLTPYIQRDKIDLRLFPKPIVDAFQVNGTTWGMPTDAGAIVTYYNEDHFAAAGLIPPYDLDVRGQWNWETFLEAARRLTQDANGDGTPDQYGVDYYIDLSRYIHWVWSNGGRLFDRQILPTKTTFSDPKSVEGLRFFLAPSQETPIFGKARKGIVCFAHAPDKGHNRFRCDYACCKVCNLCNDLHVKGKLFL